MLLKHQLFPDLLSRRATCYNILASLASFVHSFGGCLNIQHLHVAKPPALERPPYNSPLSGYSIATSFVKFITQRTQGEFYLRTSVLNDRSERWQIRSPHSLFNLAATLEILMFLANWITPGTLKHSSDCSHLDSPVIVLANTSHPIAKRIAILAW